MNDDPVMLTCKAKRAGQGMRTTAHKRQLPGNMTGQSDVAEARNRRVVHELEDTAMPTSSSVQSWPVLLPQMTQSQIQLGS